jgi:hypothetical protein
MFRRALLAPILVLGVCLAVGACGDNEPDAVAAPTASPTDPEPSGSPCLGGGDPAEPSDAGPDTDQYLGLTEQEAKDLAKDNAFTVRVAGRDGECYALTMDYRTDRVNVYLEDGTVTAATIG